MDSHAPHPVNSWFNTESVWGLPAPQLRVTQILPEEAGGFARAIDEISANIGLKEKVALFRINSPIINGGAHLMHGNMPCHKVLLSDGLLSLEGYRSLHEPLPPGIKGLLAHELSHCRDGYNHFYNTRKLPLLALPLVGAVAYTLYERAHAKHAENPELPLRDALQQETDDALHALTETSAHETIPGKPWKSSIVQSGSVLAAAAGAGGGLMMARHASLADEFRADLIGAKYSGDPKAYARMMLQAEEKLLAQVRQITVTINKELANKPLFEKIMFNIKKTLTNLELSTVYAHPAMTDRIQNIAQHFPSSFHR